MKNIFWVFIPLFTVILLASCQTPEKAQSTTLGDLIELKIGIVSKTEIKEKFGEANDIDEGKWTYHEKSVPKLWFFFKGDYLTLVSWSIWQNDSVNDVNNLLKKLTGNWEVIKEPMSNPHSAPSLCYLEDLERGRRVEVSGHKKSATEITLWKPSKDDKSIKHHLLKKVGKEFCIAGHCSKVTDQTTWEYNHCEWLEKLVGNKSK